MGTGTRLVKILLLTSASPSDTTSCSGLDKIVKDFPYAYMYLFKYNLNAGLPLFHSMLKYHTSGILGFHMTSVQRLILRT